MTRDDGVSSIKTDLHTEDFGLDMPLCIGGEMAFHTRNPYSASDPNQGEKAHRTQQSWENGVAQLVTIVVRGRPQRGQIRR
jgi:hypothetical protein